jgi:hypothetical protein
MKMEIIYYDINDIDSRPEEIGLDISRGVRFTTDDGKSIDIGVEGDMVVVRAMGVLQIEPAAANSIKIRVKAYK